VVAVADGHGLGVPTRPGGGPAKTGLTIWLAKDDSPVTGRILDLQGQPVAGAAVRVESLYWPARGDLTAWLADLTGKREGYPAVRAHLVGLEGDRIGRDVGRLFRPAVTDKDGRFRIDGVGRERVAVLRVEGPTIESTELWAMTRPGDPLRTARWRRGDRSLEMTFVGTEFEHHVAPSRSIVGVVRDKDTGRPIPGAVVQSYTFAGVASLVVRSHVRAVADKDGRYRLLGMPAGEGHLVRVGPPGDQPYLMSLVPVPDAPGLEPVTLDVPLRRGVWITGKVTDKVTGRPVRAVVEYNMFGDDREDAPDLKFDRSVETRADDGTFRFVGLPGRGVVAARSLQPGYLTGVGADRIKNVDRVILTDLVHAVAEGNPVAGAEAVACNLVLDPGRTLQVTVAGPDGTPLKRVRACGLRAPGFWEPQPDESAEFTVLAVKPGEKRLVVFSHPGKKLAGSLIVRGDEMSPVAVKLGPAGAVTGRFLAAGSARNGVGDCVPLADMDIYPAPAGLTLGSFSNGVRTDRDGRFRIEGLVPGLKYTLLLRVNNYAFQFEPEGGKGIAALMAGETTDLGDLKIELPDDQ
jgi:hypothetical protein